jgi:hypothetical protein
MESCLTLWHWKPTEHMRICSLLQALYSVCLVCPPQHLSSQDHCIITPTFHHVILFEKNVIPKIYMSKAKFGCLKKQYSQTWETAIQFFNCCRYDVTKPMLHDKERDRKKERVAPLLWWWAVLLLSSLERLIGNLERLCQGQLELSIHHFKLESIQLTSLKAYNAFPYRHTTGRHYTNDWRVVHIQPRGSFFLSSYQHSSPEISYIYSPGLSILWQKLSMCPQGKRKPDVHVLNCIQKWGIPFKDEKDLAAMTP